MGLFDNIASQVMQHAGTALSGTNDAVGGNNMASMLMGLINNPEVGGIKGLVSAFQNNGLGDTVASWISTNANLPISADQIMSVLGQGSLSDLAAKTGLSTGDVASTLSEHLPAFIDQLTPNGQLPTGDLMTQGMDLLKGFTKS